MLQCNRHSYLPFLQGITEEEACTGREVVYIKLNQLVETEPGGYANFTTREVLSINSESL